MSSHPWFCRIAFPSSVTFLMAALPATGTSKRRRLSSNSNPINSMAARLLREVYFFLEPWNVAKSMQCFFLLQRSSNENRLLDYQLDLHLQTPNLPISYQSRFTVTGSPMVSIWHFPWHPKSWKKSVFRGRFALGRTLRVIGFLFPLRYKSFFSWPTFTRWAVEFLSIFPAYESQNVFHHMFTKSDLSYAAAIMDAFARLDFGHLFNGNYISVINFPSSTRRVVFFPPPPPCSWRNADSLLQEARPFQLLERTLMTIGCVI